MKLLLTSWGITNQKIENALIDLVGKRLEDCTLVFIPTAANAERWDKSWLINDLVNLKKLWFKSIEITDFTAINEEIYLESFLNADILFFEWWNTWYLMKQINKLKLRNKFKEFLENKIYVWVSAWSMITSRDLQIELFDELYDEDSILNENIKWLDFVNFSFLPHLNSTFFPKIKEENVQKVANKIKNKLYVNCPLKSRVKIKNTLLFLHYKN